MPEQTQVVIVGAGPAGLTLGLSLARYQIKSVILEKENEIVTDPRGVYLTGDAVRILVTLGLGPDLDKIAHEPEHLSFHRTSFLNKPFHKMKTNLDALSQTLPNGLMQIQPRLESSLRRQIGQSGYCTLRTACEVISRETENPPTVTYRTEDGFKHQIQAQWLIGADGKVGVVRKHFLEASAGVKQTEGVYRYTGTWLAANLKIQLPTPQSHPKFPLWKLGYTPEQVYDLFWPKGWHFCSPPGKATASGRFGPYEERLWRHEFRQENWSDKMNAVGLLWDHLVPMITRDRDGNGRSFSQQISFPRDCVEIIRCRPFRFIHKVVNKWFHNRTILIGDAAHVFPPFAGQGIGSGIHDAHQLAWRLALLLKETRMSSTAWKSLLEAWSHERRKSVDDAALMSLMNGKLCNEQPSLWVLCMLGLVRLLSLLPLLGRKLDPVATKEREGFCSVENGFLHKQYRGGSRVAQIVVQSHQHGPMLSDRIFRPNASLFKLLVVCAGQHAHDLAEATAAIEAAHISPAVISKDSLVLFSPVPITIQKAAGCGSVGSEIAVFWPADDWQLVAGDRPGYNPASFMDRLGSRTKFALVRPDFFVYACAQNVEELMTSLAALQSCLSQ